MHFYSAYYTFPSLSIRALEPSHTFVSVSFFLLMTFIFRRTMFGQTIKTTIILYGVFMIKSCGIIRVE